MPVWPFRSKQPKLQDRAFEDLAQMFISNPQDPTPRGERLDAARLDFSVDSLAVVDAHLEDVRVDEVRATRRRLRRRGHPPARSAGEDVALGRLQRGHDGFCFPLGNVGKYLENGSEDSAKFFAQTMIAGPPGRG